MTDDVVSEFHRLRPQLVIELGTYLGGTTLFLAHQLDALGGGQVQWQPEKTPGWL